MYEIGMEVEGLISELEICVRPRSDMFNAFKQ